ncbi:arsenite methyltransferase, partial [candidate division KSB1 bacterium]|nr:arsenite methyltransferase [candidate division KSB1 bacterium]
MTETLSKPISLPVNTGCCGGSVPTKTASDKDVKKMVQDYYGNAVQQKTGCCQKSSTGAATVPDFAGYDAEVLAAIPQAAADSSFGCGDPLAFAGVKPGETVLDLGSGAGIDCFIAAQKVGPTGKVIGLDMTPAMLEAARRNAKAGGYTNVEFRKGEAEDMPIASASVDWVISNCVINLSPDKPRVFAEINRVLKPGGRLSISDIVAEALPDFVRNDAGSYCGCVGGAIPAADYLRGLTQAGLVDVNAESRLDYSPEMIRGFLLGDENLRARYGAIVEANPALLESVKIASLKIVGRKPLPNEKVDFNLRAAKNSDRAAVSQLLAASGLPENGLEKAFADTLIAEHNGVVIGVIALERYDRDALVRSFAVAEGWRGRNLGKELWNKLYQHAKQSGVSAFYLLTTTIPEMAARAG